MSKKTREIDHQVYLMNEKEKENILNEDKSKAKIKEVAAEIEKILKKYNCTITPMLQILDNSYEQELLKLAAKPAEEIK